MNQASDSDGISTHATDHSRCSGAVLFGGVRIPDMCESTASLGISERQRGEGTEVNP